MKGGRTPAVIAVTLFIVSLNGSLLAQPANHLVISEVLVHGFNETVPTSDNEFVEIYNPTDSAVDVSTWTVDYRSATGTTFNNKYTFSSGTSIPAHRYFLVGSGGVSNRDNSSASVELGLGNSGGAVFLRNQNGTTVDLLGWGVASSGNYEGSAPAVPAQGVSLERKANSSSTSETMAVGGSDELAGNGYDSDNNSNDFVQRTTPQPQNSTSPAEPALTVGGNGTGTAFISPSSIKAGSTSSFTISIAGDGTRYAGQHYRHRSLGLDVE